MKPKTKTKPTEPSLRDKLSTAFVNDFFADYEAEGISAIRALRLKSPEKYCEIATRLIAASEPKGEGFDDCQSAEEIALRLLKREGVSEYEVTPEITQQAVQAIDALVAQIRQISDEAKGLMQ